MKKSLLALLVLSCLTITGHAYSLGTTNPDFIRLYTISVSNKVNGPVYVTTDEGKSWLYQGKVLFPCSRVNDNGYTASKWAPDGAVAATAVNAIHIKTALSTKDRGVVFSIVPKEMQNPPSYYNSFLSPDSSIYTDIPAGTSIFGGGFSPFVGDPVSSRTVSGESGPIGEKYVPSVGDTIMIDVLRPKKYPREIIFENRFGGLIKIDYNGADETVIGQVLKPVEGAGRFQGTQFADVGRIRANHPGVIDVSTSPVGSIGGFQIIPSQHGMSPEMGKAREMTQWMVIGPVSALGQKLEGQPPFFLSYLQPRYKPMDLNASDKEWLDNLLGRIIVDVRFEGSSEWQPMPRVFLDGDLRKPLPSWANTALKNVTHIRILFPVENS